MLYAYFMFIPSTTVPLICRSGDHTLEYDRCAQIQHQLITITNLSIEEMRGVTNIKILPHNERVAYNLGVRYYSTKPCKHGHSPLRMITSVNPAPCGKVYTSCVMCRAIEIKTTTKKRSGPLKVQRKKNQKLRAEKKLKEREEHLAKHADMVKTAYAELWTECHDDSIWFPSSRSRALYYDLPIFKKEDGTLWRVASGKKIQKCTHTKCGQPLTRSHKKKPIESLNILKN